MINKELRNRVLDELDFEPSVDATNIGVAASGGVVTLTGHVGSYSEKIDAEEAVRRVKGVKAIANDLEVRYPADLQTADDIIARRALDVLTWDSVVPKDAIQVTVRSGWVTLAGELEWQFQKKSAEEQVRRLAGVVGVTNSIGIKLCAQSGDVKKKIEEALKRNAEVEAQNLRVQFKVGGVVELDGSVHSWRERRVAENAAWSVPGVQRVFDNLSVTPEVA